LTSQKTYIVVSISNAALFDQFLLVHGGSHYLFHIQLAADFIEVARSIPATQEMSVGSCQLPRSSILKTTSQSTF